MLSLIHQWLKVPVEEEDEAGRKKRTGGKDNRRGTPQGGVISPLLSNIYMNRFVKTWREWKMEEKLGAKVVVYADDFVILSRRRAQAAMEIAQKVMGKIGLKLNERKTRIVNARQEGFDFLGYSFGPKVYRPTGRTYLGVSPSKKAEVRYKEKIRAILKTGNPKPWEEIAAQMNRITEGWARHFSYGTVSRTYWHLDAFLVHRVRNFLRRRHKIPGRGSKRITAESIFASEGLFEGRGLKSFASLKRVVTSYAFA
jgi:RNA-directed DNA polymerase